MASAAGAFAALGGGVPGTALLLSVAVRRRTSSRLVTGRSQPRCCCHASGEADANNTARYLGSATGIAVVALLVTHARGAGSAGLIAGWNTAALVTAGFSLLGALIVLLARDRVPTAQHTPVQPASWTP